MEERHRQARLWLESLFSGEESDKIPGYEVTPDSVSALSELYSWSSSRDSELESLLSVYRKQIQEYEEETERLNAVLSPLGLCEGFKRSEASLVDLCMDLGIDDPDTHSIRLEAAKNKTQALVDSLNDLDKEGHVNSQLKKKVEVLSLLEEAKTSVSRLESEPPPVSSSESKKDFLLKKHKEYKRTADKYRQLYLKSVPSEEITHSGIQDLCTQMKELEVEVDELRKKIQGYHELPPSLELSDIKVQEAKMRLKELDDLLNLNCSFKEL